MGQSLDDMRLFAALAEAGGFSAAAVALGIPKQTMSRRIALLEGDLGVRLVARTTRVVRLTDAGVAFAERCAEVVRLADEAREAVSRSVESPTGTLRITATEALGEAFVAPVLRVYLERFPAVDVEVLLAERRVDLVAEGFDVAVRVGRLDDSSLVASRLGPAEVRYVASPGYLAEHGLPVEPADLRDHACLAHGSEARLSRWPFADGRGGVAVVSVRARLAVNHVGTLLAACRQGLGIAMFPAFLVDRDIEQGRLVPVLADRTVEVGGVWLVTPSRRLLTARVRAFLEVAKELGGRLG